MVLGNLTIAKRPTFTALVNVDKILNKGIHDRQFFLSKEIDWINLGYITVKRT